MTLGTTNFTSDPTMKGATAVSISKIDLTEANSARHAISVAQAAIDMVSSMRSDFGAMQNRLDHTINNLSVQEENIRLIRFHREFFSYFSN